MALPPTYVSNRGKFPSAEKVDFVFSLGYDHAMRLIRFSFIHNRWMWIRDTNTPTYPFVGDYATRRDEPATDSSNDDVEGSGKFLLS